MNFHSTFLCFPGKELKINVRLCGEGELEMNFKWSSSGKECMCVCVCVCVWISHFSFRLFCSLWALDPSTQCSATDSLHFRQSAISVLLRLLLSFANLSIHLHFLSIPLPGCISLMLFSWSPFPNRCCSSYPFPLPKNHNFFNLPPRAFELYKLAFKANKSLWLQIL